ncbi:MAG: adenosylcobinamide-GDP ribazoletransferase [Nitrospira sp.]|nr:adenosylcobinamide-GDP ribazoletransferase [Nitrospira sp.]
MAFPHVALHAGRGSLGNGVCGLGFSLCAARWRPGIGVPHKSVMAPCAALQPNWPVALTTGLGAGPSLATMGVGVALVLLVRQGCGKWFGGVTGDVLGATNELVEILFLLLVPVVVMTR